MTLQSGTRFLIKYLTAHRSTTNAMQANLKSLVTMESIQELLESETEPSSIHALVQCWREGDEFWLFDYTPGDKGYALVRDGQIVDFEAIVTPC